MSKIIAYSIPLKWRENSVFRALEQVSRRRRIVALLIFSFITCCSWEPLHNHGKSSSQLPNFRMVNQPYFPRSCYVINPFTMAVENGKSEFDYETDVLVLSRSGAAGLTAS